jgi:hypothetical protein
MTSTTNTADLPSCDPYLKSLRELDDDELGSGESQDQREILKISEGGRWLDYTRTSTHGY